MRRSVRNALAIIGGLGAVLIGFLLLRTMPDAGGIMDVLPFVLIGVGCGLWAVGRLAMAPAMPLAPRY